MMRRKQLKRSFSTPVTIEELDNNSMMNDAKPDSQRTFKQEQKKQQQQQTSKVVPMVTAGIGILMVVMIVVKGRGSRGVCLYDNVYRKFTCKQKQLHAIPTEVSSTTLSLIMGSPLDKSENVFTALSRQNFTKFTSLQELDLVKCGIEEIQSDTFADLKNLKRLDLRFNRIQMISEETFKGLTSLDVLDLSNNPIHNLGDFIFRGLRIERLVLANNPALEKISDKTFAGAIIKSLEVNRCNLNSLKVETLSYIAESLQELSITHNMQPLSLPDDIFKNLKLKTLALVGIGLSDTDVLEDVIAEEIILDDNPLDDEDDLDFDESKTFKYTKVLSLRNCRLSKITKENLSMLINLERLDLDNNDLTTLNASAFDHMDNLQSLDVSGNDIDDFEGNFTEAFPELDELFLDGNDIQTIPETLEPLFSRLENLTLHYNPLHCNCEIRWFVKWLETHRHIIQNVNSVKCETPISRNLTHVSDYGFKCRAPTIFNATIDTDGISLQCTAEGDPPPIVTWVSPKGSEKTTLPPRDDRESFKTRSSLTITKEGNYTCIAKNIAGEDTVTVNTRHMPTSGLKFHHESQEIEILESKYGFLFTFSLLALLGYVFRTQ